MYLGHFPFKKKLKIIKAVFVIGIKSKKKKKLRKRK